MQSSDTSFLLGPNTLLSNLFSNTLNLRDQVSQLYNTTHKIIVLYILIFKFLERIQDDKKF
jgi:hypothetical protein